MRTIGAQSAQNGQERTSGHAYPAFAVNAPGTPRVVSGRVFQSAGCRQTLHSPDSGLGKLRSSLDALARETAILADRGNAGARLIVDELRKRGVTINPKAPPAGPDKNPQ